MIFNPPEDHPQALSLGLSELTPEQLSAELLKAAERFGETVSPPVADRDGLTPEKRAELLKLCEEESDSTAWHLATRDRYSPWSVGLKHDGFIAAAREWLPRLLASLPVASEAGLETTAEEREQWLSHKQTGEVEPCLKQSSLVRLLRDFDRLLVLLSQARAERDQAKEACEWAVKQCDNADAREAAAREEERERDAKWHDDQAIIAENNMKTASFSNQTEGWRRAMWAHKQSSAAIRARSQS